MSINSSRFSLRSALAEVWEFSRCLSDDQKDLISQCIDHNQKEYGNSPNGEEDMLVLHRVMAACDYLRGIGEEEIHWLNDEGKKFPEAIRKYVTSVAWYFHNHDMRLDGDFLDSLADFVIETKSHVATLNYDNLLYQEFIERDVLRGYQGALVDGIWGRTGFRKSNLERRHGRGFGYYLHLHGSPLFIDNLDEGLIVKQAQGCAHDVPTKHLVLTHIEHKRAVIAESPLLSAYWEYFEKALAESERVVLVGYSGLDKHLNEVIRRKAKDKGLCVVEWGESEGEEAQVRRIFWEDALGGNVQLVHLDNIQDFRDWFGEQSRSEDERLVHDTAHEF